LDLQPTWSRWQLSTWKSPPCQTRHSHERRRERDPMSTFLCIYWFTSLSIHHSSPPLFYHSPYLLGILFPPSRKFGPHHPTTLVYDPSSFSPNSPRLTTLPSETKRTCFCDPVHHTSYHNPPPHANSLDPMKTLHSLTPH